MKNKRNKRERTPSKVTMTGGGDDVEYGTVDRNSEGEKEKGRKVQRWD